MLRKLFKFHGGLKLPSHKAVSSGTPIRRVTVAAGQRLVIPLFQRAGCSARPVVSVGDLVRKGQKIGAPEDWLSTAAHASTSGRVTAIEPRRMPHPSGLSGLAIEIEADGEDQWIDRSPIPYASLSPEENRRALQEAGVVGLGGAVFPSHAKLSGSPTRVLVINGAECEPYITCDDSLTRERAGEVVAGIRILRDLLGAREVLVGVKESRPEALAALRAANEISGGEFRIAPLPDLYPVGNEKHLIHVLTGISIPADRIIGSYGVQCFNVGTVYSVARAFLHGEPLVSRVVTLTGQVANPGNWEVPIGMSVGELLALARPEGVPEGVVMGGPMMGFDLPSPDVPVVKACNCLIARAPETFPAPEPEMPCIRCGECARACPQGLQPFELYWWSRARQFDQAERYHMTSCVECGCCAYVCPAHIPLAQYFRFAKGEIRMRREERRMAALARERFEFRQFREARDKAEKAERLARAAAAQSSARLKSENAAPKADDPESSSASGCARQNGGEVPAPEETSV